MAKRDLTSTPSSTPTVPAPVTEAIDAMRAPIMVSHVVPDADALGSMLAMARACASQACKPRVSLPTGSLSQRLAFLCDWACCDPATPKDFSDADGFVVLDTADRARCNVGPALKETDWSAGRELINIDHHATNSGFGTVNWVEDGAGSTCELVYELLRAMDNPIDEVTASLLYAGIQTDTLGFTLSTTTASALSASAALVEAGARVGELGDRIHRSQRTSEFDLLRIIYANTKVLAGGGIAYSWAGFNEIRDAGCTAADIDDQINVPRSLEGVRLAMLFTEGRKGRTRINFRGSGNVTVVELAALFHGGGHAQAAGAIVEAPLDETIEKVLPRAADHLAKFPEDPQALNE